MTAWTEERRQKHREAIRKWKPWEKSTGPKTIEGKIRSSLNAYKHGKRTIPMDALSVAVRKQKQLYSFATRYARGVNPNELLDDPIFQWLEHCLKKGNDDLMALFNAEIMQKPCFSDPFGANS